MDKTVMNAGKSVALSIFSASTSYAIDPKRIGVLESAYPGCIEVHLCQYDQKTERTPAGGSGLTFAGNIPIVTWCFDVLNRRALIAGFDEVFEVSCQYESVVVLRPLGIGLGINWERYRQYAGRTHRKARLRKKFARKAKQFLAKMRLQITALTGHLDRPVPATGPFYLREETDGTWKRLERPLSALTVHEARLIARKRIAKLRARGWVCGQEASFRGQIDYPEETESTIAWLCLRGKEALRVSVEAGVPENVG